MLASRRARPGVTLVLLAARVSRGWGNQALALVRRERLVLGPGLAQVLVRRRARRLGEMLVVLARLPALLGREACPDLHAPLHALLLLRLHARIALGDGDPLLPAVGLERVPVGLERRERLLLLGGELGPGRTHAGLHLRGPRGRLGGRLLRDVGGRLRRGSGCDAEEERSGESAQHHSSVARVFRKFWKPRSR